MKQASLHPLFYESMRQGILMALPLTLLTIAMLFCIKVPLLSACFFLFLLLVPITLYYSLAKVASVNIAYCNMGALWMSGIIQFICGGLILALLVWIYFILNPGFIADYFRSAIEMLMRSGNDMPDLTKLHVPPQREFVFALFWANTFLGCILSMIFSIILPFLPPFTRLAAKMAIKRSAGK